MASRAERLASRFADLAEPIPDAPGIADTADRPPSAADRPQYTVRTPDPAGRPGWDATHRRVTYWLHLDVIRRVRGAAERNGESVASFVDRALRAELQRSDG